MTVLLAQHTLQLSPFLQRNNLHSLWLINKAVSSAGAALLFCNLFPARLCRIHRCKPDRNICALQFTVCAVVKDFHHLVVILHDSVLNAEVLERVDGFCHVERVVQADEDYHVLLQRLVFCAPLRGLNIHQALVIPCAKG